MRLPNRPFGQQQQTTEYPTSTWSRKPSTFEAVLPNGKCLRFLLRQPPVPIRLASEFDGNGASSDGGLAPFPQRNSAPRILGARKNKAIDSVTKWELFTAPAADGRRLFPDREKRAREVAQHHGLQPLSVPLPCRQRRVPVSCITAGASPTHSSYRPSESAENHRQLSVFGRSRSGCSSEVTKSLFFAGYNPRPCITTPNLGLPSPNWRTQSSAASPSTNCGMFFWELGAGSPILRRSLAGHVSSRRTRALDPRLLAGSTFPPKPVQQ